MWHKLPNDLIDYILAFAGPLSIATDPRLVAATRIQRLWRESRESKRRLWTHGNVIMIRRVGVGSWEHATLRWSMVTRSWFASLHGRRISVLSLPDTSRVEIRSVERAGRRRPKSSLSGKGPRLRATMRV